MGGWIESWVYRMTDRNNLKYNFYIVQFVFRAQPGAGRELCFECFSASFENSLVLTSGDVGVGCKVLADMFVGLFCVVVFSTHWWCRGEELSSGF